MNSVVEEDSQTASSMIWDSVWDTPVLSETTLRPDDTMYSPSLGDIHIHHQLNPKHTATVIFLHGSGETGSSTRETIEDVLIGCIALAHIQILFPTAPIHSYVTELSNQSLLVWYERKSVRARQKEVKWSADLRAQIINSFIEGELVASGIPHNRIIIGGFEFGGSMALHVAYRYCPKLAGVFTLSSLLNHDSLVYETLELRKMLRGQTKHVPPLFSCHGDQDQLLPFEEGYETFKNLTALGVKGEFHRIEGLRHDFSPKELHMWLNWMVDILKDDSSASSENEEKS